MNYTPGQQKTMNAMNPPKRKICLYLTTISHNVKDFVGGETSYTDTYKFCSKLKKRMTTRQCIGCVFYEPLDNNK